MAIVEYKGNSYNTLNRNQVKSLQRALGFKETGAWGKWQQKMLDKKNQENYNQQNKNNSSLSYNKNYYIHNITNYLSNLVKSPYSKEAMKEVINSNNHLANQVKSFFDPKARKEQAPYSKQDDFIKNKRVVLGKTYDITDPNQVGELQSAINKYLGVEHLTVDKIRGQRTELAINSLDQLKDYYDNKRKNLKEGEQLLVDKNAFLINKNGKIYGTTPFSNGMYQEYDKTTGRYKDITDSERGAALVDGKLYDADTEASKLQELTGQKVTGKWSNENQTYMNNMFNNSFQKLSDSYDSGWKGKEGQKYKTIINKYDAQAKLSREKAALNKSLIGIPFGLFGSGVAYWNEASKDIDYDSLGKQLTSQLEKDFNVNLSNTSSSSSKNLSYYSKEQLQKVLEAPENKNYAKALNYLKNSQKYLASLQRNDSYTEKMIKSIGDNLLIGALNNLANSYTNKKINKSEFAQGFKAENQAREQENLKKINWTESDENIAAAAGFAIDLIPDLVAGAFSGGTGTAALETIKQASMAAAKRAMLEAASKNLTKGAAVKLAAEAGSKALVQTSKQAGIRFTEQQARQIMDEGMKAYTKEMTKGVAKQGVKAVGKTAVPATYWGARGTTISAGNQAKNTGEVDWNQAVKEGLTDAAVAGAAHGALNALNFAKMARGASKTLKTARSNYNQFWQPSPKLLQGSSPALQISSSPQQLLLPPSSSTKLIASPVTEKIASSTPFLQRVGQGVKGLYDYTLGGVQAIDRGITSWANNANVGASRFIRRPIGFMYDAATFGIKHPVTATAAGLMSEGTDAALQQIAPDMNPYWRQMLASGVSAFVAPMGVNYGKMKLLSSATNSNGALFNSFLGKNINNQTATGQFLRDKTFTGLDPRLSFWRGVGAQLPSQVMAITAGNIPNAISGIATGQTIGQNLADYGVNENLANTIDAAIMLGAGKHTNNRAVYTLREMSGGKQGFADQKKYFLEKSGKQIYVPGIKRFTRSYYDKVDNPNIYQRFIINHGINDKKNTGLFTWDPQSNKTPKNSALKTLSAILRLATLSPGRNYNQAYHSADTKMNTQISGNQFAGNNLPDYNLTSYNIFGTQVKGLKPQGQFVMSDRMPSNLTKSQQLGWAFARHNSDYIGNGQHFSLNEWSRSAVNPENYDLILMNENARKVDLEPVRDRQLYKSRETEVYQTAYNKAIEDAKQNPSLIMNYEISLLPKQEKAVIRNQITKDINSLRREIKAKLRQKLFPGKETLNKEEQNQLNEAVKNSNEFKTKKQQINEQVHTLEYRKKAMLNGYASQKGSMKVNQWKRNRQEFRNFVENPEGKRINMAYMLENGQNPWEYQFWSTANPAIGEAGFTYKSGNKAIIMNDVNGHGEIPVFNRATGKVEYIYGDHGEAGSGAKNNKGFIKNFTNWFISPWLSNSSPRMYTYGLTGGPQFLKNGQLSKNNLYEPREWLNNPIAIFPTSKSYKKGGYITYF